MNNPKKITSLWNHINEELLPNALMIGVQYEVFWELTPKTLSPFIKAFLLKQKYDDFKAWQMGYYNNVAIGTALSKNSKYPTRPLMSDKEPLENEEVRQQKIKQRFIDHAKRLNSKFGGGNTIDGYK